MNGVAQSLSIATVAFVTSTRILIMYKNNKYNNNFITTRYFKQFPHRFGIPFVKVDGDYSFFFKKNVCVHALHTHTHTRIHKWA